jgi:glycosyltransferase involved in cell wall biosynthesis
VLASLHRRKGLEHFLRAVAWIAPRVPAAQFVVAGEGPERGRLETLRHELGLDDRVRFPGSIRPVRELLAASDLFVLSSLEEGISNALLEAQSEGVPAVVTDVGGNAEVVEHGRTGLVVPPGDPDALAQAIGRLLASDPERRTMGAAAAARTREVYSLERMTRRMESYYENIAGQGSSRDAGFRRAR